MRMPSRRTFWLSAATLLVAVVASAWVVMPRSRITQANFDRIQKGMTRAEVKRILGPPSYVQGRNAEMLTWEVPRLDRIDVFLDVEGKVDYANFYGVTAQEYARCLWDNILEKVELGAN
jgi:hypothetical protein